MMTEADEKEPGVHECIILVDSDSLNWRDCVYYVGRRRRQFDDGCGYFTRPALIIDLACLRKTSLNKASPNKIPNQSEIKQSESEQLFRWLATVRYRLNWYIKWFSDSRSERYFMSSIDHSLNSRLLYLNDWKHKRLASNVFCLLRLGLRLPKYIADTITAFCLLLDGGDAAYAYMHGYLHDEETGSKKKMVKMPFPLAELIEQVSVLRVPLMFDMHCDDNALPRKDAYFSIWSPCFDQIGVPRLQVRHHPTLSIAVAATKDNGTILRQFSRYSGTAVQYVMNSRLSMCQTFYGPSMTTCAFLVCFVDSRTRAAELCVRDVAVDIFERARPAHVIAQRLPLYSMGNGLFCCALSSTTNGTTIVSATPDAIESAFFEKSDVVGRKHTCQPRLAYRLTFNAGGKESVEAEIYWRCLPWLRLCNDGECSWME